MYFEDRAEAGRLLAARLVHQYRYEDCAVIALSDGAVLVAEQIAIHLHCVLMMLMIESIAVPGESVDFGAVAQTGIFSHNGLLSAGELEGYEREYHGYFEEEKRHAFQRINRLLGDGGVVDDELVRDRVVILVSDGFEDGLSLGVAMDFLKPLSIKRLVVAAPIASIAAVDRLHILADELHILDVKDNFMGTNHYYDNNTIPSHDETIAKINQIVLNWVR